MEKEIIKIVDGTGVERDAEVTLCFESDKTKHKYVIYTFNEVDDKGMIVLYAAIANEGEEETTFTNIENEEEWAMVKEVMKKIVVDWKE